MLWEHRPLVIVFTVFCSPSKDLYSTPHLLLIWWGIQCSSVATDLCSLFHKCLNGIYLLIDQEIMKNGFLIYMHQIMHKGHLWLHHCGWAEKILAIAWFDLKVISCLIKTITKFLNVVGYLSSPIWGLIGQCIRIMLVIGQYTSFCVRCFGALCWVN